MFCFVLELVYRLLSDDVSLKTFHRPVLIGIMT